MASADLTIQRSLYIGNSFSAILYGVQFILCIQSIHYLRKTRRIQTSFYIGFSLTLLFLNAIELAANSLDGQYVWIERGQTTPGGPIAWFDENTTWWVNTFGTAASVAADVMSQALMLYRCYIIMASNIWVILFPTLIFLASTALGILSTVESALPNNFLLSGIAASFGVPWISISVSFNVVVTAIISVRLLYAHRQMKGISTPIESRTYTGVIAIMVESALPLAVAGLLFAVFYGKNSPAAIAFAGPWGSFVGISPQLIILRVAMGVAWSRNTLTNGTSNGMSFARPQLTGSTNAELNILKKEKPTRSLNDNSSSSRTLNQSAEPVVV